MAELAKFQEYWPVVIIEAPEHSSVESMEFFCAKQEEYFKRRERFAIVNDMTRMRGMLDAKTRKVIADWTKAHEVDVGRWVCASANVVENTVVRGIITAVHWIVKPPNPLLVTGTMREGLDFVVDHLRREKVPLSPKLTAYLRSVA